MKTLKIHPSLTAIAVLTATCFATEICSAQTATNLPTKVWGAETVGYAISIWTPKPKYSRGEAIQISMSVKNCGTNEVCIAGTPLIAYQWNIYEAIVLNEGQPYPPTAKGSHIIESWKRAGTSGWSAECLKPGEESPIPGHHYHPSFPLNDIYDLSAKGKYRIKLTRDLRNQQKLSEWVKVASNEIEITIE